VAVVAVAVAVAVAVVAVAVVVAVEPAAETPVARSQAAPTWNSSDQ
jgi:hypothetical protein